MYLILCDKHTEIVNLLDNVLWKIQKYHYFCAYKMSSFERKGNQIMTTLGKEIKKACIDKGLKQKDLMALTGLAQKHLSLIENDDVDPRVSVLRKIALALRVSADQLLGISQVLEKVE